MNRFGNLSQPLMGFVALLLTAFVAGCGGGSGGGGGFPAARPAALNAAGAVCSAGAACVPLGTAGTYVILAQAAITDVPTSAITGNVGASPISGTAIGVPCAEVSGTIFDTDGGYTGGGGPSVTCRVTDATGLGTAVNDSIAAYTDAAGRPAGTLNLGAGTLTAQTLAPGTYTWGTGVNITGDLTLAGTATDVWIFQVNGTLTEASATNVTLTGGALSKNVFWQVSSGATIGTTAHFSGIIITPSAVTLGTGASLDGRLFTGTSVALDGNAVTRPN